MWDIQFYNYVPYHIIYLEMHRPNVPGYAVEQTCIKQEIKESRIVFIM